MKQFLAVVPPVAVAFAATVNPAHAQQPTTAFDPNTLAASFTDVWFWIALLTTLIAGAVGGVAYELLALQGSIEMPHRPTDDEFAEGLPHAKTAFVYDLGIWSRVILGGVAAVAAMLILSPTSTFALIASAIVAGIAATAVLRSLQDRLVAVLSANEALRVRAAADRQNAKVGEAMEAFTELRGQLRDASSSAPGTRGMSFSPEAAATVNSADLDEVERLLGEAMGMHGGQ